MGAYLFVCKPEENPGRVRPGNGLWWSCSRTTAKGDRIFVYVTGVGVAHEWRASSDAEPDDEWKYVCDVGYVSRVVPAIPIRMLRAAIPEALWKPPHLNFRGYRSIEVPTRVEAILDGMRGGSHQALEDVERDFSKRVKAAQKLTSAQRRKRIAKAGKKPGTMQVTTTVFQRNPDVVAEVLERANGDCEVCEKPAPFRKASDGSPYLEVHHRIRLADGGDDTVENAVALCPNCHRAAHYGSKRS